MVVDRGRVDGAARGFARPALVCVLAGLGAVLCAVTVVVTVSGAAAEYAWLDAIGRGLTVGVPLAVGLYAWSLPAYRRFGALLFATGVVIFIATLAESSEPDVYAVGRIAGWVVEPLLIYLILAFPSGRLRSGFDRALVGLSAAIALTLFFPTAFLVERYPEPSTWTSCLGGCPDNAFMVTGSEPALIEDFVRPLREIILVLILAVVIARVSMRLGRASRLMRRTLIAVLGVAVFRLLTFAAAMISRAIAPHSDLTAVWVWLLALGVPLLAAAFLLGLAGWRLFLASAVQRLTARFAAHPRPANLRSALAETFEDPSLTIVYWHDEEAGWTDAHGHPVASPANGTERCLTEIHAGDQRVAAIVHDAALRDEQVFIDAATAYTVLTRDNDRLGAEAAAMLAEVQGSRARIQATADEERRRIERDLHDGAQQRLVALRIQMELAAERVDGVDGNSADLFRQLGTELDGALDEVRSLARGIYPPPLADWGLVSGLRSAARHAPLATTVRATGVRTRYSREVESAAYFCCLEAMQNAAKHARGASSVVIELSDNGVLSFEIRDDGAGFDLPSTPNGVGLTNMHDRIAAVTGELAIESRPGEGTRIRGRIPLPPQTPG